MRTDNLNPKEKDNSSLWWWLPKLLRNNRGEIDGDGGDEGNEDNEGNEGNEGTGNDGGDGSTSNWFDTLDPDLKSHPSVTKFKDPAMLAKSYIELEKMVGKNKIVIPDENASQEEWDKFYKAIGKPDDLTGYDVPEIEGIPDEVKLREEQLEAFRQKAHELGLNKKQFAELYALQLEMSQKAYQQQVEEAQNIKQKTETELRKEWGAAYDKKVDSAQKLINAFFKGKELNSAFTVLANDKGFVQAMSEIAEKLGEDSIVGSPRLTMTPKEAQEEYNKMMGDLNHPLHNELHPEHQAAVEKSIELQRMIMEGDK